ncbi:MAG: phosphoserine phosphatase SerB [Mariprofundaceae bacterium]
MSVVVLAPPNHPISGDEAEISFLTPGGGKLLLWDKMTPFDVIDQWHADPNLEVWQRPSQAPCLRVRLSACLDFASFKEVCTVLAVEDHITVNFENYGGICSMNLSGPDTDPKYMTMRLRPLSERLGVDIAILSLPPTPSISDPGCLFMDMDSTLIECECIDEIADFLGIREKVASITLRAMEGELDFSASFLERVQLLQGLKAEVLHRVYEERIRLTSGAENLISSLSRHGWKTGLVSGGFTFFTDRLKDRLHLDFAAGNNLEIKNGLLTGRILGPVIDAREKRRSLIQKTTDWNIPLSRTVAIGDGANDIPMLEAAALGIAFHAKAKVREVAPYSISHGGLDQTLDLLGLGNQVAT